MVHCQRKNECFPSGFSFYSDIWVDFLRNLGKSITYNVQFHRKNQNLFKNVHILTTNEKFRVPFLLKTKIFHLFQRIL